MRSVLFYVQIVRRAFENVANERDAMVFENLFIEPSRDVLRCMVADPELREEVLDGRVKLNLLMAREAQQCLDSWRFERTVLSITN
jgi:hypothetical protein